MSRCRPSAGRGAYASGEPAAAARRPRRVGWRWRGRAARAPSGRAARGRAGPARVDLAAGQVQVGLGDQAALVALQRHPLREHVVGVGQARASRRAASRPGTRRSTRSAAGRSAGGRRGSACAGRSGRRRSTPREVAARVVAAGSDAWPPHTRRKPRSRYIAHSSSFTHERRSSRARCSARRSRPGSYGAGRRRRGGLLAGAARVEPAVDPRHRDLPQQREDDDRGGAQRDGHARPPRLPAPPAARGKKITRSVSPRDLLERAHHLRLAAAGLGGRRHGGPHALVELAAELLDERLLVLARPRRRPRRSAARRSPDACGGTSSRPIIPEAPRRARGPVAPTRRAVEPEDVDRARGRRRCSRRPSRTASAAIARGGRRGLERRVAEREVGGERATSACSPSRGPRRRGGARR